MSSEEERTWASHGSRTGTGTSSRSKKNHPMYVVSDSALFIRRGGSRSKNETILTEAATFLGKTTHGLVLKDIICVKGAKGKELAPEVERIMQFSELAPLGCKGFGLVCRAVLFVFWNCNAVA